MHSMNGNIFLLKTSVPLLPEQVEFIYKEEQIPYKVLSYVSVSAFIPL